MTTGSRQQVLLIEFNEINFEFIERYIAAGRLPAFRDFIARHGYSRTTSEREYETLEPWIQWVTAHTGLDYADHGVFRLGDIVDHDIPQIWEQLEAQGLTVGAISPMNAKYRLKDPAFFVPDPWTQTDLAAAPVHRRLYRAIARAVNDNAVGNRATPSDLLDLLVGAAAAAKLSNYPTYVSLASRARKKPWLRALVLDLLLSNLFSKLVRKKRVDFASLFLNAGAHIQHHYMFSSTVYDGSHKNPEWYVPADADPLLDVYELYDEILGSLQRDFPAARIMFATGLHQEPYPKLTYYWRLKDHAAFLSRLNVTYSEVQPLMSRDFVVRFADAAAAAEGERRLLQVKSADGASVFDIDNRGDSLFVTLAFPDEVTADTVLSAGNERYDGFKDDVAFVAIKNGEHDGIGYFGDSGSVRGQQPEEFPLRELPRRICAALELQPIAV